MGIANAYKIKYQLHGKEEETKLLARNFEMATKNLLRDYPSAKNIMMVSKEEIRL